MYNSERMDADMKPLSRRFILRAGIYGTAGFIFAPSLVAQASALASVKMFKSPWCGCCGAWAEHMQEAGFQIDVTELEDLEPIKRQLGVPTNLQSCHTAIVDNYVIEGHVPADEVKRLLRKSPKGRGLAVPGMPVGSPGMEMDDQVDSYQVILFGKDSQRVFAEYS